MQTFWFDVERDKFIVSNRGVSLRDDGDDVCDKNPQHETKGQRTEPDTTSHVTIMPACIWLGEIARHDNERLETTSRDSGACGRETCKLRLACEMSILLTNHLSPGEPLLLCQTRRVIYCCTIYIFHSLIPPTSILSLSDTHTQFMSSST